MPTRLSHSSVHTRQKTHVHTLQPMVKANKAVGMPTRLSPSQAQTCPQTHVHTLEPMLRC